MALHSFTNKTVAVAGTAVSIAASHVGANWVILCALPANAGIVYIGDSTVTNAGGAKRGIQLNAGQSAILPAQAIPTAYDLAQVFVNADTIGDGVSGSYGT